MTKSKSVPRICLTAIAISFALLLGGCDDYPEVKPKLVDGKKGRILNHEIADRRNVKFRATYWQNGATLRDLHNHYCVTAEELGHMNDWARRQTSSEEPALQ